MFKPNLSNYGYGFFISETPVGNAKIKVISHSGGINGFATLIVRLVDSQSAIILLSNVEATVSLSKISRARITNILYDQPYDAPKRSIAETLMDRIMLQKVRDAAMAHIATSNLRKRPMITICRSSNLLCSRPGLSPLRKTNDAIAFLN